MWSEYTPSHPSLAKAYYLGKQCLITCVQALGQHAQRYFALPGISTTLFIQRCLISPSPVLWITSWFEEKKIPLPTAHNNLRRFYNQPQRTQSRYQIHLNLRPSFCIHFSPSGWTSCVWGRAPGGMKKEKEMTRKAIVKRTLTSFVFFFSLEKSINALVSAF